jgi:hypothetical protein
MALLAVARVGIVLGAGLVAGVHHAAGFVEGNKVGFNFTISLTQDIGLAGAARGSW